MKSMIPVPLDILQTKLKYPESSKDFGDTCILSSNSTGLYLYSETTTTTTTTRMNSNPTTTPKDGHDKEFLMATFECRQFPKNSGYPEDPATGIAAAALAVYTHRRRRCRQSKKTYPKASLEFRQGTAMGRPSLITIRNIQYHDNLEPYPTSKLQTVSLECGGRVEIDEEETLTL
jgi:hypothetical protein